VLDTLKTSAVTNSIKAGIENNVFEAADQGRIYSGIQGPGKDGAGRA
jgi:hypothetical protein